MKVAKSMIPREHVLCDNNDETYEFEKVMKKRKLEYIVFSNDEKNRSVRRKLKYHFHTPYCRSPVDKGLICKINRNQVNKKCCDACEKYHSPIPIYVAKDHCISDGDMCNDRNSHYYILCREYYMLRCRLLLKF